MTIDRDDSTDLPAAVISGIHKVSGASSKVPKTNLESLTVGTLKHICANRKQDDMVSPNLTRVTH